VPRGPNVSQEAASDGLDGAGLEGGPDGSRRGRIVGGVGVS